MNETERYQQAVSMTANRVLVTCSPDTTPLESKYCVTYFVGDDQGVSSIEAGVVEYLVPGDFDFLYDEDSPKEKSRQQYVRSYNSGSYNSGGGGSYSSGGGGAGGGGGSYNSGGGY